MSWLAVSGLACGSEQEAAVAASGSAIMSGERSGAGDDYAVRLEAKSQQCSGVLIAPNLVLTALHCVSEIDLENYLDLCTWSSNGSRELGAAVLAVHKPEDVSVYVTRGTVRFPIPPTARVTKILTPGGASLCSNDIAVLRLDVELDLAPAVLRLDSDSVPGDTMTLIGYGFSDQFCTLPAHRLTRTTRLLLSGPGFYIVGEQAAPFFVPEGELLTGEGTCLGDSGGPILASTGAVVGLSNHSDQLDPTRTRTIEFPCRHCVDSVASFASLHYHKEFVESAFEGTGYAPWREGRPRPVSQGEVCEFDQDCNSGVCVGHQGARFCSTSCDTSACPAGLLCAYRGERKVCTFEKGDSGGCAVTSRSRATRAGVGVSGLLLALTLWRRRRLPIVPRRRGTKLPQ